MDTQSLVIYGAYLISAAFFILGLKRLGKVRSARGGNTLSGVGMAIAIVAALFEANHTLTLEGQVGIGWTWVAGGAIVGILIGGIAAIRVQMTEMPEMVALFNGSGGVASALVGGSYVFRELLENESAAGLTLADVPGVGGSSAFTVILSILIGMLTLTGSIVAYLKLRGKFDAPILLPGRNFINLLLLFGSIGIGAWAAFGVSDPTTTLWVFIGVAVAASILGVMAVIPIGGADMPVVISLMNSYSGLAACATGFVLNNSLLIVAGALVGASGLILTKIMCVAMNRSLANVLFAGFGATASEADKKDARDYKNVRSADPESAAMILEAAESVIFVPGYGLAVAQAQHACKELGELLKSRGCKVTYAIHPVAGRMPGHMNVLLAEADVPYDELVEMDEINPEFKNTDVVIVAGANDVVNPVALTDPNSPIAGMPILTVHEAKTVFVIKRSLSPGFAQIKNPLFEAPNAMMMFGDAKGMLQGMITELKEALKAA
ncbi:MAG: NAD(P)(+) transhydrogenase (Re/Si-specific) subunit beta [Deltaproteobacteria bacterium]|nr:NAD(P)(+) transhydrogenase (Re/Si-specific) subunit beta [Deltaproteobacteria bacterium]